MGLFVIILSEFRKMIKQYKVYYLRNDNYNIQEISVLLSQYFCKFKKLQDKRLIKKDMRVNTYKGSVWGKVILDLQEKSSCCLSWKPCRPPNGKRKNMTWSHQHSENRADGSQITSCNLRRWTLCEGVTLV